MAHGNMVIKRNSDGKIGGGIGSRRIFAPQFKLQVLDSYRNDVDCKGNQRATARKYGIHRRQIQKWLQVETNLRNSVLKMKQVTKNDDRKCLSDMALSKHRQQDDTSPINVYQRGVISTEQRVPYIHIPTSPILYTPTPLLNTMDVSNAPVCTSPESVSSHDAHRVPITATLPLPPCQPCPQYYRSDTHQHTAETALDFTTHTLNTNYYEDFMYENLPPCCPIDLSIRKSYCPLKPPHHYPILDYTPPYLPSYYNHQDIPPELDHLRKDSEYEIWDLSMKKETAPVKKPHKLFKPYLLDDDDYNSSSSSSGEYQGSNNNNKNEVCLMSGISYGSQEDSKFSTGYDRCYDSHYISSMACDFEDSKMNENNNFSPVASKQRQSYSVNFKLSAIESYYKDDSCKGKNTFHSHNTFAVFYYRIFFFILFIILWFFQLLLI